MPITIFQPTEGILGPGVTIHVQSDLTWPVDEDWHWQYTIWDALGEKACLLSVPHVAFPNAADLFVWGEVPLGHFNVVQQSPLQDGQQARLGVQLLDGLGNVREDVLGVPLPYEGVVGLPAIASTATGQGGLTEEQAQQLATTADASALAAVTDALTLTELTSGPTGSPLVAQLLTVTFGILIRLTSIPEGLAPQTPDMAYWVKTLATVRIFRGNDLWLRVPIHTPTKVIGLEKEGLTIWVANVTLHTWMLNMRVLVDFLPGVTGQVFQMHFP